MNLMDNLKMLPEFLFTVGHSMQDISRDDFSLLNDGGETVTSCHTEKKDMCPTLISRIQHNQSPINPNAILPKHLSTIAAEDNVAATAFASVKLEDTNAIDHLFPTHPSTWQQHPMNSQDLAHHRFSVHHRFDHSNSLLLQGSDDPLISHGANSVLSHDDEHPADFAKSLLNPPGNHQPPALQPPPLVVSSQEHTTNFSITNSRAPTQQVPEPQKPVKSGCSSLTKQQLKVKANLMSARNQQQQQQQLQHKENNAAIPPPPQTALKQRPTKSKKKTTNSIKLRFHHQALPPEYLSHYEATQGQARVTKPPQRSTTNQQRSTNHKQSNNTPSKHHKNSHENVRSWLQKIAEIQRTANASKAEEQQNQQEAPTQQKSTDTSAATTSLIQRTYDQPATPQRLPLDANNNPQQQRRLQSASEQGQLSTSSHKRRSLYADLPYMGEITLDNSKPRRGRKPKKADICHLIYKNYGTILPKRPELQHCVNIDDINLKYSLNNTKTECEDQPLNLCLRDQPTDSYSISSADDISETNSSCPTPVTTPSDFVRDSMLANNLKNSLTNLNELDNEQTIKREKDSQPQALAHKPSSVSDSMLNPITMYYHKLLESGVLLHNANGPIKTIQKDNQLALKIPIPSGLFIPSHRMEKPAVASPAPSNGNNLSLEYPEQLSTPSSVKSENSSATNASSNTALMGTAGVTPQKRKRSAIFIPPMNIENTSNPTTEVSICKFKFTGGSKPTLQEKKMLSVDAGGNYRYFSGTGDKTTRGYEYFPRESLQQGLLPGVNCTGQKLLIDIPPPSSGLSNELLHIPESPTSSMLLTSTSSCTAAAANGYIMDSVTEKTPPPPPMSPPPSFDTTAAKTEVCSYYEENSAYNQQSSSVNSENGLNNRLVSRKKQALHQLRKSSQREKLEKTFKEQGFLIQTQQLEAEGATYCKFRQLKKFTRYLFRNWKDYLPSDLPEEFQRNTNAAAAEEEFSKRCHEKENASATATTANLSMKTCQENGVTRCSRDENVLE